MPGTITLSENIVCVICQTSAVIFSKNASSSGSLDAITSSGRRSASRNFALHDGPSASVIPCSSPLDRPSLNANTVDRSMPIAFGFRCSTTSFSSSHCSSPQSSACRPFTGLAIAFAEVRASNRPPCDVPPSAIRSTHAAEGGAPLAAHLSKKT